MCGMYKYVKKSFQESFKKRSASYSERLQKMRRMHTIERIEKPSNPTAAREIGYKATKDFIVVCVRIKRGKRDRPKAALGRKSSKMQKKVNPGRSLEYYAKEKALRKYKNLFPVGACLVGQDGVNKYFEVILQNKKTA